MAVVVFVCLPPLLFAYTEAGREMLTLVESNTHLLRVDLRGNRIAHMRLSQFNALCARNRQTLAVCVIRFCFIIAYYVVGVLSVYWCFLADFLFPAQAIVPNKLRAEIVRLKGQQVYTAHIHRHSRIPPVQCPFHRNI